MEQETPILLNSRMCLISFTAEQVSAVHIIASLCRVTVPDYQVPPQVPTNFPEIWVWLCWAAASRGKTHPPNLKGPLWLVRRL